MKAHRSLRLLVEVFAGVDKCFGVDAVSRDGLEENNKLGQRDAVRVRGVGKSVEARQRVSYNMLASRCFVTTASRPSSV
jgi:hypothetical protein